MKRFLVATVLSAALLANAGGAVADPASDKDMANRYLQAAQSGSDDAQFYLAALYSTGVGVARSDEEAFRWFSRAAEQGHSHAMLILGGLYAVGRGAPKDNIKAYKWAYIVGTASRVEEFRNGARQLTGLLETRMTPQEVDLAKGEAGRWQCHAEQPAGASSGARRDPARAGCVCRGTGRVDGDTAARYAATRRAAVAGSASGQEKRFRRSDESDPGLAQEIWLLGSRDCHEAHPHSPGRNCADRRGRRWLLRVDQFHSRRDGDHSDREPSPGVGSDLRHRHGGAGALGQGGAAAAAAAGQSLHLRGPAGEGRPGARPHGRRRGAKCAERASDQFPAGGTRPRPCREGPHQERPRAKGIRAALDPGRGIQVADRGAAGADRSVGAARAARRHGAAA